MWWERHKIQKQVDVGWSPGPASYLLCPLGNRHFTPWGLGTGMVTHLAVLERMRDTMCQVLAQCLAQHGHPRNVLWTQALLTVDLGRVTH